MRGRNRLLCALLACAPLAFVVPAAAQPVTGARLGTQEQHPTRTLPEPQPHWVYVLDPVFPHLIASKIYIVDGDSLDYKGMLNTGYLPNLVIAPDKSALYVAETFWSRGSRGERSDVVTRFDPKTLLPQGEVGLAAGRFLVVTKTPDAAITPDGRYLLSYNMDPAMSVSVVDVQQGSYLGEIEIPGCALIYPTGPTSFVSLCPDGSFLSVSFDAQGVAQLKEGQPWFDAEKDPVFEHAAMHRPSGQAYFVSYLGHVYPVGLRDGQAQVSDSWSLLGSGDEGWRPGGWQLASLHAATHRMFVLMHKGGASTHKQAGEEVWVFDTATKQRIQRIPLEHHAISVSVTQDNQPLLFTLSEEASLSVFDATTYQHKADKEGIGDSPFDLYVTGE